MQAKPNLISKAVNTILWGNSVALTWTWGIGLFFSVQVAIQFGFQALIAFATIDAVGLTLFGLINAKIVSNYNSGEEFEKEFLKQAANFKFALLFYQFLAITLTIFCCLKYITLPLGIFSFLVAMMFIGAVIFLGEEFPINKIKYSHAAYSVIIFIALWVLLDSKLFSNNSLISAGFSSDDTSLVAQLSFNQGHLSWFEQAFNYVPLFQFKSAFAYYMFWIPIVLGFLCGPWLDLQNWQRVVQIKKENTSIAKSYIVAGLIFWLVLMADGMIALACYTYGQTAFPEQLASLSTIDSSSLLFSAKSTITQVLKWEPSFNYLLSFYMTFVGFAALSTFDSGYITYKWYTESILKDSKNLIFSFVPVKLLNSGILWFTFCVVSAICTLHFTEAGRFIARFDPNLERFFRFELEYYLAFFASFFLVYSVVLYRAVSKRLAPGETFSSLKLFSSALSSIAIFGIGYFSENPVLMGIAALLPFIYGWAIETNTHKILQTQSETVNETKLLPEARMEIGGFQAIEIRPADLSHLPVGAIPVSIKGCYIKDHWFVHSFIPTYQDTNSVGNVYFAMYLMWVGKTRELFFAHVLPNFDPKTSPYLILTRSIDHKFQKEIKEFDEVTIQIKIGDYNRKFVTLEHQILDLKGELVGKGKQMLMFVDSKNYGLVDLPAEVSQGFMPYISNVKGFVKE